MQRQQVIYVTERAVFELREDGVHLVEIAPGIDLEKDVLARMGFMPHMNSHLSKIDSSLFKE